MHGIRIKILKNVFEHLQFEIPFATYCVSACIFIVNCVLNISFTRNNGVSCYFCTKNLLYLNVLYSLTLQYHCASCRQAGRHAQVRACALISEESAKRSARACMHTHTGTDMHTRFYLHFQIPCLIYFFLSSVLLAYSAQNLHVKRRCLCFIARPLECTLLSSKHRPYENSIHVS
jgi:hypothetical protein